MFAKKLPDSAEKPYKSAAPTEKPAFKKTAKPKTENPRLWVTDDKGLAKATPQEYKPCDPVPDALLKVTPAQNWARLKTQTDERSSPAHFQP